MSHFKPAICPNNCIYKGVVGTTPCCNYVFMTDHLRPCPPGSGCTVYDPGKKKKKFPEGRAMRLYEEGWTDAEIAADVGLAASTFGTWRRRTGRPPNKRDRHDERTA